MNWKEPKVYAVKHKDFKIRMDSRSGGFFSALSDEILSQSGVIYGCVLTDEFNASHIRAECAADRDRMRGSKYIQSSMGDIFKTVEKDLKENRVVMFSGTSCQVAGLKRFLGKEYDNLLCIDIVCHGVPSPLVWQKYLQWQKGKYGKIVGVDFRNKKDFGWAAHIETLTTNNGKKVNSKVFTTLFYKHSILRPSCYACPYKDIMHPGDITIADYWGIDKAAPGFNDNKGVSLVLINNKSGEIAFETVKNKCVVKKTELKDSMQTPLEKPFGEPDERTGFWKDFNNNDFEYIVNKYGDDTLKRRLKIILMKGKYRFKNIFKL